MIVAILIMVTFLVAIQVLGLLGFANTRARNEAAKKIAQELHDLERPSRRASGF